MSDLHAVLTARIDELERIAHVAAEDDGYSPDWTAKVVKGNDWSVESESSQIVDSATEDDARHIAAWDPATVLRGLAEDRVTLRLAASLEAMAPYHDESPHPGPMTAAALRNAAAKLVRSLARRHDVEVPDHG